MQLGDAVQQVAGADSRSNFIYENWFDNSPSKKNAGRCSVMQGYTGRWLDIPCNGTADSARVDTTFVTREFANEESSARRMETNESAEDQLQETTTMSGTTASTTASTTAGMTPSMTSSSTSTTAAPVAVKILSNIKTANYDDRVEARAGFTSTSFVCSKEMPWVEVDGNLFLHQNLAGAAY